jgi:hypothetical protein
MRPPVGAKASQFLMFSTVLLTVLLVNWVRAVGHGVFAGRRYRRTPR